MDITSDCRQGVMHILIHRCIELLIQAQFNIFVYWMSFVKNIDFCTVDSISVTSINHNDVLARVAVPFIWYMKVFGGDVGIRGVCVVIGTGLLLLFIIIFIQSYPMVMSLYFCLVSRMVLDDYNVFLTYIAEYSHLSHKQVLSSVP